MFPFSIRVCNIIMVYKVSKKKPILNNYNHNVFNFCLIFKDYFFSNKSMSEFD